jgi:Tol biopolymer transport system component
MLIAPRHARAALSEPVWSPDGTQLAYVSELKPATARGSEAYQLMLFDRAGTRAVIPLRRGIADFSPAWSPDATVLAFSRVTSSGRGLRSSIVTRVLLSGAERVLVTVPLRARLSFVGEPEWSPDGAAIGYTHSRIDRRFYFRPTIRTVPAGGGASRLLMRDAQSAAWSSDGRLLAFASVRERNGSRCGGHECSYAAELYVAAADGSAPTRLTNNKGEDAPRPHGHQMARASCSRATRTFPRATLRRSIRRRRRELPYVADQRYAGERRSGLAAGQRQPFRPRQLRSGRARGSRRCSDASAVPRRPLARPPIPGLLLSRVSGGRRRQYLSYNDCERFDARACPVRLTSAAKSPARSTPSAASPATPTDSCAGAERSWRSLAATPSCAS